MFPGRNGSLQNLPGMTDQRKVNPRNVRFNLFSSCGQNHHLRIPFGNHPFRHLSTYPHDDPYLFGLGGKPRGPNSILVFIGRLTSEAQLSTRFLLFFVEGHLMAETGGLIRCGQTTRARSHDPHITTVSGWPLWVNDFLSGLGIEGATDFPFPQHQALYASLIAGNTFSDIFRTPFPRFD